MTQFKAFTCVAFRKKLILISSCLLQSNCKNIFVTFALDPNKGVNGSLRALLVLLSVMGYSAIFILRAGMASRVKLFLAFVLNSLKTAETDISAQIFPLATRARRLKSSGNAESLLASIKQKSERF